MKSCTIIVSHYESINFLKATIRQIRKYEHPEIKQTILICDQSSYGTWQQIENEYGNSMDIILVHTLGLYSGYGIDYCIRHIGIKTDYICQVHVDIVPISKQWLLLPITLIEEYNLSFVGQLQFVSDGTQSIYPPSPIFAMAQCFNIARTETYRELSLKAGFTRFHNRPQSGLSFENNDWADWAKEDYNARGSDDDVVAFHYEDKYLQHDKLGFAITGFCQPSWGRIIEDVVFHFGSCREAANNLEAMPELYRHYTKRINANYDEQLIDEMVNLAKQNKPPELDILNRNFWNGKLKQSSPPPDEINKRIEELKLN